MIYMLKYVQKINIYKLYILHYNPIYYVQFEEPFVV